MIIFHTIYCEFSLLEVAFLFYGSRGDSGHKNHRQLFSIFLVIDRVTFLITFLIVYFFVLS